MGRAQRGGVVTCPTKLCSPHASQDSPQTKAQAHLGCAQVRTEATEPTYSQKSIRPQPGSSRVQHQCTGCAVGRVGTGVRVARMSCRRTRTHETGPHGGSSAERMSALRRDLRARSRSIRLAPHVQALARYCCCGIRGLGAHGPALTCSGGAVAACGAAFPAERLSERCPTVACARRYAGRPRSSLGSGVLGVPVPPCRSS